MRRTGLPILAALCLVLSSPQAFAQQVEGCDPEVLTAMQNLAEARVAHSNSVDDAMFDQDDSVLAMTCFNQSAAQSANAGGIFSGPFANEMAPVVEDGLAATYDDFNDSAGAMGNTVDYSAAATHLPGGGYNCRGIQALWDQVESEGIDPAIPYVTFNDLVAGDTSMGGTGTLPPGASDDYARNWRAAADQGVFRNLETSMQNLDARVPGIPTLAPAETPCAAMSLIDPTVTCAP